MAVTLKEAEAIPASYPPELPGLSDTAKQLDRAALWQRIEAYCRTRWSTRKVVWTVEGGGAWEAPLEPATITTVEVWQGGEWVSCTPAASPWGGFDLPGEGPYRITADVGGGPVPAGVNEAFRRLAEYLSDVTDRAGVSSYSLNIGGSYEESYQRSPAWQARAMDLSGAADLLRPYKRRA